MDKRWKNLIIVFGVITLLGFIYYLYISRPSFVPEYSAMLTLMEKYGVDAKQFPSALTGISRLSEPQLEKLSTELKDFSNKANEAWLKDLALIYSDFAEMQLNRKKLAKASLQTKSLTASACERISLFNEMADRGDAVFKLAEKLFRATSDFSKKHPNKTAEIKLYVAPTATQLAKIRESYKMQSTIVGALKEVCK